MSENTSSRYSYTQNRELSWLRFNKRVLEEAADKNVPVLERLKFISIFSSNLDEFFMVRVGSLFDIAHMNPLDKDSKTGWSAKEQLHHIYKEVPKLLIMKKKIYDDVFDKLKKEGIKDVSVDCLDDRSLKKVNHFFKMELLPILSPILIGPNHPIPHLVNKKLYVIGFMLDKKGHKGIGIVPVPEKVPAYLLLDDGKSFIRTENIIMHWLPLLFDAYNVKEKCIMSLTRNADISFDDEKFEDNEEDFRYQMKKMLKQRDYLSAVRLELSKEISLEFKKKLALMVKVEDHQIFIDSCPLNMHYVYDLISDMPKDLTYDLLYKPYHPLWAKDLLKDKPIISQIKEKDHLLFYPYDSVEPFLDLLNEAADDPCVLSIKITIYRLAQNSKIAKALCKASENGKEVLVLMELRARFDEENNLKWSKILEEFGCQVIYGSEGYKCHSKICLITLRHHQKTSYITQIGTGNYNEKTNCMYTDLSLITANMAIGEDASAFFRNMLTNKLDGDYKNLYVSPFGIKTMLMENIDKQIMLGKDGYICIKANAITECDIINKLKEASCANVEIKLIIRGICCLLPDIKDMTENIQVTSIVGRFLEHARIYQFGKGEEAKYYISSADLMTRNLNRRVEIACPVYDKEICQKLKTILDIELKDTAKASIMLNDGSYKRKYSEHPFDSQAYFMQESLHEPAKIIKETKKEKPSFYKWLYSLFKHNENND